MDDLDGGLPTGLQFHCVKLFEAGRPLHSPIDVIAANVRVPDMTLGGTHAQAASVRLGKMIPGCEQSLAPTGGHGTWRLDPD
jgi:hypothetical protein